MISSCEKVLIKPTIDPSDQLAIFDEFQQTFSEKYAMFEFKGVDWTEVVETNRALINSSTTDEELFEIIGEMILLLRDGHTFITDHS